MLRSNVVEPKNILWFKFFLKKYLVNKKFVLNLQPHSQVR